jgi:hypothetical protein
VINDLFATAVQRSSRVNGQRARWRRILPALAQTVHHPAKKACLLSVEPIGGNTLAAVS